MLLLSKFGRKHIVVFFVMKVADLYAARRSYKYDYSRFLVHWGQLSFYILIMEPKHFSFDWKNPTQSSRLDKLTCFHFVEE